MKCLNAGFSPSKPLKSQAIFQISFKTQQIWYEQCLSPQILSNPSSLSNFDLNHFNRHLLKTKLYPSNESREYLSSYHNRSLLTKLAAARERDVCASSQDREPKHKQVAPARRPWPGPLAPREGGSRTATAPLHRGPAMILVCKFRVYFPYCFGIGMRCCGSRGLGFMSGFQVLS